MKPTAQEIIAALPKLSAKDFRRVTEALWDQELNADPSQDRYSMFVAALRRRYRRPSALDRERFLQEIRSLYDRMVESVKREREDEDVVFGDHLAREGFARLDQLEAEDERAVRDAPLDRVLEEKLNRFNEATQYHAAQLRARIRKLEQELHDILESGNESALDIAWSQEAARQGFALLEELEAGDTRTRAKS